MIGNEIDLCFILEQEQSRVKRIILNEYNNKNNIKKRKTDNEGKNLKNKTLVLLSFAHYNFSYYINMTNENEKIGTLPIDKYV